MILLLLRVIISATPCLALPHAACCDHISTFVPVYPVWSLYTPSKISRSCIPRPYHDVRSVVPTVRRRQRVSNRRGGARERAAAAINKSKRKKKKNRFGTSSSTVYPKPIGFNRSIDQSILPSTDFFLGFTLPE